MKASNELSHERYNGSDGSVYFEMRLSDGCKDTVELRFAPAERIGYDEWSSVKKVPIGDAVKWRIATKEPIQVHTGSFLKSKNAYWLTEPGDSILFFYHESKLQFRGRGREKFELQERIQLVKDSINESFSLSKYEVKSVEEYLKWNEYLNQQLKAVTAVIDFYSGSISAEALIFIKALAIKEIEDDRQDKFWLLRGTLGKNGLTNKRLCDIFDSTFYSEPAMWLRSLSTVGISESYSFIFTEVQRKFLFDSNVDSMKSPIKRRFLYYEHGNRRYKGLVRERFLLELICQQTIREFGFNPQTEYLLEKYYSEPGLPQYKQWVRNYEARMRVLRNGKISPHFQLTDANGRSYPKDSLNGKIALLDFWFTGCVGCAQVSPIVRKIEKEFENDTNAAFVSISIDRSKEEWLKSVNEGKFTTGTSTLNLYTGGKGNAHNMIKDYSITRYPSFYLLDEQGLIIGNPLPDPRDDSGKALIETIRQRLALLHDGPHVLDDGDVRRIYKAYGKSVSVQYFGDDKKCFEVPTDEYSKTFNVELRRRYVNEPSEFERPSKIFVLSDIEGNFDALRKLLQSNGVIDSSYNWIFGDGHLVLNGDLFDRGKQVTECLWLIYSLEDKARAVGGYVHFILGNHEIMNLSGNTRYINRKYKENLENFGKSYIELYGLNSELGKWIRTKNIMERIGDILFVHGGISEEVARLPITIGQINELARLYYDKDSVARQSEDLTLALLFDSKSKRSPFWYREYYLEQERVIKIGGVKGMDTLYRASANVIENALDKFGVNRIVTGHTIVGDGDSVTIHYNGKVINTDTNHAKGKSEALLIEGHKYSRANITGAKTLLFYSLHDAEASIAPRTRSTILNKSNLKSTDE